jgi:phage RecT family recombinase
MPDGQGRELTAAQRFNQQLDQQVHNFRALLPSHIPVERFKRTVVVAVAQNPDLFNADRRSFFNAAQKCASDGLLPDGRQAALVVFNTKMKVPVGDGTYEERWIPAVQYMPMIQGIRERMRNTGQVLSAEAHVVYQNDKFFRKLGDDPAIIHEPPAFGVDRGRPVGAYAIIRLKNGEIIREVMDQNEIERVRAVSKAKDGPAWKGWWDEMARKTVLRRASKSAPTSAEMAELMSRDDEPPEMPSLVELAGQIEPEPQRQIGNGPQPATNGYLIVDADGEEHEYRTAEATLAALVIVMRDARKRGRPALEAAHENNAATIRSLPADMQAELDPFGLPPSKEQTSGDGRPEDSPGAAVQQNASRGTPRRGDPLPDAAKLIAELEPPRADLASDEPDWPRYADAMCELIGRASVEDLQMQFSALPHMQKMRAQGGDQYRRVMDAVRARSVELQERAA